MNFKRLFQYAFFSGFIIFSIWGTKVIGQQIFPKENTSFNISKKEVTNKSDILAAKFGFSGYSRSIVLDGDGNCDRYHKYKLDGVNTWNAVKEKYGYDIYNWSIRYFKNYDPNELTVFISPEGEFVGFNKIVSDEWFSKKVSKEQALAKVKKFAEEHNFALASYKEAEYKFKKQKNGRLDHSFVFEHKDKVGDGLVKYSVSVRGAELTAFTQWFKVPDAFLKEYSDMRALNGIFSNIGLSIGILYIIIMLVLLIKYFKEDKLNIKSALYIGIGFFALTMLDRINSLPQFWNYVYSTTSHVGVATIAHLLNNIAYYAVVLLLFVAIAAVAITLDKEAFPAHHNIASVFNKHFLASNVYLQLVLVGLLIGVVKLLQVQSFYYLAEKYFGWTSAGYGISSSDFSGLLPGIFGLATAPKAGLMEELFMRVLPIGVAVWYAKKSKRRWVIPLAFVIQWIGFSGLHIGYPSIPFYFRIVEFIIPVTFYALIYYYLGVIPAAIVHYFYDFILMVNSVYTYPEFFGYTAAAIVTVLGLTPIWIHVYYRYVAKVVPKEEQNKDLVYGKSKITNLNFTKLVGDKSSYFVGALLAISLFKTIPSVVVPEIINRDKAISVAKEFLTKEKFNVSELTADIENRNERAKSVMWSKDTQKFNEFEDQNLTGYLWNVSSKDRENLVSHNVRVSKEGQIVDLNSFYKDSIAMTSLSEKQALIKAGDFVRKHYRIKNFKLNDVDESKKENRTDWTVIYKLDSLLKIRVQIFGDKIGTFSKYVDIEEKDSRDYSFSKSITNLIFSYSLTMEKIMLLIILIAALMGRRFAMNRSFPALIITSLLLGGVSTWNKWDSLLSNISIASNLQEQLIGLLIIPNILAILQAIIGFSILFSVKSLGWKQVGSDWIERLKPILYFSLIYIFVFGISQMLYFNDSIAVYAAYKSSNLGIFLNVFSSFAKTIISWLTVLFAIKVVNNKLFSILATSSLAFGMASHLPGEYWHVLIYGAILWVSIFFIYEIYWKKDVTSLPFAVCVTLSVTHLNLIKNIDYAIGLSSVILLMVFFAYSIGEDT